MHQSRLSLLLQASLEARRENEEVPARTDADDTSSTDTTEVAPEVTETPAAVEAGDDTSQDDSHVDAADQAADDVAAVVDPEAAAATDEAGDAPATDAAEPEVTDEPTASDEPPAEPAADEAAVEPAADEPAADEPAADEPAVTEPEAVDADEPARAEGDVEAGITVDDTVAETTETPETTETTEVVAEVADGGEEPVAVADDDAAVIADHGPVTVNDPDTAEAGLIEAGEIEQEIRDGADAAARMEEITGSLEAVRDGLLQATQEGGLSRQAARFMSLSVDYHRRAMGLGQPLTPALESFGGQSTRLKQTEASLESIEGVLKEIAAAIVAALQKVSEAVIRFLKQLAIVSERLKLRGEKLVAMSKGLDGAAKVEQIDIGPLINKLCIGGKYIAPMDVIADAEKVAEGVKDLHGAGMDYAQKSAKAINELFMATDDTFEAAIEKAKDIVVVVPSVFNKTGDKLPGGSWVMAVDNGGVSFHYGNEHQAHDVPSTVPVLSVAQITQTGEAAVALANHIEALKDADKSFAASFKGAIENVKESEDLSATNASQIRQVLNQHANNIRTLDHATCQLLNRTVRIALAAVQVAEKSALQYQGAKDEAGEPAAA